MLMSSKNQYSYEFKKQIIKECYELHKEKAALNQVS
ncbi:hypothetical protein H0A61_00589 [Koleobacter methoxysyntrophicus]|uniref:Transposase n=1 Tax=Koleobacter methoxysyntrophicus TaxID=2751313 RepID=A0A8A0RL68_9FIRM|nr:hypothetical protein H0A61_00589 [Koleobacter methoxysyntrophicus]